MSPSDEISDEELAKSPFHGKATARIAQETGDPLANVDQETAALKSLAQKLIDLPDGEAPSQAMIQEGLDALTKLYTVRGMPVTSVMIMTTAMLQAVNIELFELGMWQAWSSG